MIISGIDESQRRAARVAGVAGLLTMATAVAAFYGISFRLNVAGDVAATARNIMANEVLFRISVVCFLVYCAGIVVLTAALYTVLSPISRGLAVLASFWRLIDVGMWAAGALNSLFVLRLLGGADYLKVYEQEQLLALVRLTQGRSFDGYYVGLPFFGLSSTVWFCLWFKSRYIPRALAFGGAIAAAWCAASAFIFLVYPEFGKAVNLYSLDSPLAAFEMGTFAWILVRGLKQPQAAGRQVIL